MAVEPAHGVEAMARRLGAPTVRVERREVELDHPLHVPERQTLVAREQRDALVSAHQRPQQAEPLLATCKAVSGVKD